MSYVSEMVDPFTDEYPSGLMDHYIEHMLNGVKMCEECYRWDVDNYEDDEFEDSEDPDEDFVE